ncbi:hypothetical protein AB0I49_21720 [Streptomyces sp. NPDC050617]|uniref:hypothetical protein n=1 Tax=Streptomyces sp. NPDC050617 TaxID=3154628 RepID=UPI0034350B47
MRRRLPRRLFTALAASTLLTLTGCVTVHGEREILPAVSREEAPKVLQGFTDAYNKAYRELDPAAVDAFEAGPLAANNRADLTAQHTLSPGGNKSYPALEFKDPRFTIPAQAGWPKFFVADAASNRDGNRWYLVFTRDGAKKPWRAAYLSILNPDDRPEFAAGKDGWAEPVPVGEGSGLVVDPAAMSGAYTTYLQSGKGKFAPGQSTSRTREAREKLRRTPSFWTAYIDTPAGPPEYAPLALRTKDGGAVVFFTAHHREKRTLAKGVKPAIGDPRTRALLTGDFKRSVTFTKVSESAVRVPSKDAGGQVSFLNRIEGLTAVKGD